jgi:hypothetical protein
MTDRTGNVIGILFVVCVVIALAAIYPYVDPKPSKINIDLPHLNLEPAVPATVPTQTGTPPTQPTNKPLVRNSANDAFVQQQMDQIERSKEHMWQMSVGQDPASLQNRATQKELDYYHEKNKPSPDPYQVSRTRHDANSARAASDQARQHPY